MGSISSLDLDEENNSEESINTSDVNGSDKNSESKVDAVAQEAPVTTQTVSSVSATSTTTSTTKYVTISQIISSSASLKSYVAKNHALPSSVKVGSYSVSQAQFSYLMGMAIKYIKAGKKTTTKIKIINVSLKTTSLSVKYTAKSSAYVSLAKSVASYCSSNKKTPTYGTVNSKKIDYRSYTYGFAKILAYYKSKKRLPSSCLFESGVFKTPSNAITLNDVLTAASVLNSHVSTDYGISKTITVKGTSYDTPQFLYMMAMAIKNINAGKTSATYSVKKVSVNKDLNGDWISVSVSKNDYVTVAGNVVTYIDKNARAPNYATLPTNNKKADYKTYAAAFASTLTYYKNHKVLPSSQSFSNLVFESYYITNVLSSKKGKDITFYLTTDNIIGSTSDNDMLNSIKSNLTALGYKVEIVGVGPNKHNEAYQSGCTGQDSVLICCFGAVDVGCIEEWAGDLGNWFPERYNGANILPVFYLDPYGCAANIHDSIDPAWDADYGWTLDDSAKYMADNGISYIQTGTVARVCSILKSWFS